MKDKNLTYKEIKAVLTEMTEDNNGYDIRFNSDFNNDLKSDFKELNFND